ncbi:MAG TPA: carboxylating nicotinate-nucleotide diphosphorylase [Planctomycetaceae bacterium]|nr:carboxylating nicotinate-nucleotide diphosphorylase [Planctomycetaceae bacterium]
MAIALTTEEQKSAERLVALALAEDLGSAGDITSRALIAESRQGAVNVVVRRNGVLAGVPVAEIVLQQLDRSARLKTLVSDGEKVGPGNVVAEVHGSWRCLLAAERTVLNFLMHLSGIATRTRQFVDAIAGTKAVILDTRKTLPGWRLLEKYAVRAGGGTNHRIGLFDGCLIKDNHLAAWQENHPRDSIAGAIAAARNAAPAGTPIEVEVDTLSQLREALAAQADIVLLDNMEAATIAQAVEIRDSQAPRVLLEASGGVTLETVGAIAAAGVDRISVGGITHSASALDMAFDWPETPGKPQ